MTLIELLRDYAEAFSAVGKWPLDAVNPVLLTGPCGIYLVGQVHTYEEWHVYEYCGFGSGRPYLRRISCHDKLLAARHAARKLANVGSESRPVRRYHQAENWRERVRSFR